MNTNDKRYIKNEKLIRETFMKMLLEKRYAEITVNELCERAFISKNAFYYHHENLDSLIQAIMDELFVNMMKIYGKSLSFEEEICKAQEPFDFNATFDYFEEHMDVFYPLFLRDEEIGFTVRMVFSFKKAMFSHINPDKRKNMDVIMLTEYVLNGSFSLVKSWILNNQYIDKISTINLYRTVHSPSARRLFEIGRKMI